MEDGEVVVVVVASEVVVVDAVKDSKVVVVFVVKMICVKVGIVKVRIRPALKCLRGVTSPCCKIRLPLSSTPS